MAAHSILPTALVLLRPHVLNSKSKSSRRTFEHASKALDLLAAQLPDVFNHNLETVPRLYKRVRPGGTISTPQSSERFQKRFQDVPTKSGLMLGLGEEISEVEAVMQDLRDHGVSLLTLGQYLQPTRHHLPVERYVDPQEFKALAKNGYEMGFSHVASGPMVRSSYHADQQAKAANLDVKNTKNLSFPAVCNVAS